MKTAVRESDVEAHLKKRVAELGGETRKVAWIGRPGAPDRLVLLPGGPALWVELKRPGKTATEQQAREHARLWGFGQSVVVLDSIEAVDRWATELRRVKEIDG